MNLRKLRWHSKQWFGALLFVCSGCQGPCDTTTNTGKSGSLDNDGDGATIEDDCDDNNASVFPGASEICGDGVDNDCQGGDAACAVDADGDGFTGQDDCNDNDAAVHPGAAEVCSNGIDDNCDGIGQECLTPVLVYKTSEVGSFNSYGVAIADGMVTFGNPSVAASHVGDGNALWFNLSSPATSYDADAIIASQGPTGAVGGYGLRVRDVGDFLCVNADYHDGTATETGFGKGFCYTHTAVSGSVGAHVLPTTAASFTVEGATAGAWASVLAHQDVTGDGFKDLVVRSTSGLHVVAGSAAGLAGAYVVPRDAAYTLTGECSANPSTWCGFGSIVGPDFIAVSGKGSATSDDHYTLYALPLGANPQPAANAFDLRRNQGDTATATSQGFAIGNSYADVVHLVDPMTGAIADIQDAHVGSEFGHSVAVMVDQGGHELLLVGATAGETKGTATGLVYVFDLTYNPQPTSTDDASFALQNYDGLTECGRIVTGGVVVDNGGATHWSVATSCPGTGGAVWALSTQAPPAPVPSASDIVVTGPDTFAIKKVFAQRVGSRVAWIQALAQSEGMVQAGVFKGYRLHKIFPNSTLYRAGLRAGDVVEQVNATKLTGPAAINELATHLTGVQTFVLKVRRSGVLKTITYNMVN